MASDSFDRLVKFLREWGDSCSIRHASQLTGISVDEIRNIVQSNKGTFDLIGIAGGVGSWAIALSDPERPIQLVLTDEESDENKSK